MSTIWKAKGKILKMPSYQPPSTSGTVFFGAKPKARTAVRMVSSTAKTKGSGNSRSNIYTKAPVIRARGDGLVCTAIWSDAMVLSPYFDAVLYRGSWIMRDLIAREG